MAFRTSTRSLLPTIVASVAAGRLALAPTAPAWAKATTSTTVETIPVTFDTFSCGGVEEGEPIDLEGDIRSVSHLTIEPHGGIHLETQVQFSLVGVGEITGTIYRFNNAEHSSFNGSFDFPGLPTEQTFTGTSVITARGGETQIVTLTSHQTISADGVIKTSVFHLFTACPQGTTFTCGDGVCEGPENSCSCPSDCGGSCVCAHSECVTGERLHPACSSCAATVCSFDPFCCNTEWDDTCVMEAEDAGCCCG